MTYSHNSLFFFDDLICSLRLSWRPSSGMWYVDLIKVTATNHMTLDFIRNRQRLQAYRVTFRMILNYNFRYIKDLSKNWPYLWLQWQFDFKTCLLEDNKAHLYFRLLVGYIPSLDFNYIVHEPIFCNFHFIKVCHGRWTTLSTQTKNRKPHFETS